MTKYLISIIILSFNLYSQVKPPKEYVISSWNLDEGLPQSTVSSLIQTNDGYIWLATWGGLVRFDGVKFTVFNRSNTPGMEYDRILRLFEDKDGGMWLIAEQGVLYYKNGVFKTISRQEGLPDGEIWLVKQDKEGAIWLLGQQSIFKYVNKLFIKQEFVVNDALRERAMNGEGDFFFAYSKSITRLIDGKLVYCLDMSEYTNHSIWDVVEDKNGALWISTNGDGLFYLKKNKMKHYTHADGLFSNNLRKTLFDNNGDLWIAGLGGISRIVNDKIYTITKKDGLSDTDVIDIIQDKEGNYWAGTITGGLNKLRKSIFTVYDEEQGLETDKLLSLYLRDNGTLLIGTNCGGIYELTYDNPGSPVSAAKISYSLLNKAIKNTCIWSLIEDSKKRIWISAKDLISVENGKISSYSPGSGFNGTFVWASFEDSKSDLWIGCTNGLFKFHKGVFTKYTTKDGLSSNEVHTIFEDKDKNLWIGTINGLNKISNNEINSFAEVKWLKNNYIRAIYQDKDGTMWFGSYGGGIIRLKDNKFIPITSNDGLFDDIVSHIVEDNYGYFWMGSNKGISRVSRQELNDFADGIKNSVYATSYGKSDGMGTVETNGGFQPSAIKDKWGRIYFPTVKGLIVVNPENIQINASKPEVHIEKFFVSGRETNIYNAHIPYDSSDIQIQYTALSYVDPKKVKFKYKIEGYDEDWINAVNRRSAYYTKLPPGEYKFTVIASNNDGIWNEKGASVYFTILPPFWMTWWFRTAVILLLLSIGPIIYYRRVAQLKKERNRQEEFSWMLIKKQEEERSRIAQELHDSLGQELLLIKNRALLGLKAQHVESKTILQLEHISQSASSVINLVRQISHNLRPPELDRLGLTETIRAILSDVSDSGGIIVNSAIDNIDGMILKENEINIVRIIQEALNNILKHSMAARIDVFISAQDDKIKIEIADNGKGFSKKENFSDNGDSLISVNGKGLGLTGMNERVHILKGTLLIDSTQGEGTRIIILIPRLR